MTTDELDAAVRIYQGATARLFYTMNNGVITITGVAQDQIAAGSFYTHYNCNLCYNLNLYFSFSALQVGKTYPVVLTF